MPVSKSYYYHTQKHNLDEKCCCCRYKTKKALTQLITVHELCMITAELSLLNKTLPARKHGTNIKVRDCVSMKTYRLLHAIESYFLILGFKKQDRETNTFLKLLHRFTMIVHQDYIDKGLHRLNSQQEITYNKIFSFLLTHFVLLGPHVAHRSAMNFLHTPRSSARERAAMCLLFTDSLSPSSLQY